MKLRRTWQTEKGGFSLKKYSLFTLENIFTRKKSMHEMGGEKKKLS
jgi:hypothetical protein